MSWNIETNPVTQRPEVVIRGFENGIADSPYTGIADMRNINVSTATKQANVAFANAAVTLPPTGYTTVAYTAASGTDEFTTATTAGFYTGMALTIVTVSGAGGVTAGLTYYVGNITATTFKLYYAPDTGILIDITLDISGTFTVPTFGTPSDSVSYSTTSAISTTRKRYKDVYICTSDGLVWVLNNGLTDVTNGGTQDPNRLTCLGNIAHSTAGSPQTGIAVFNDYLLLFTQSKIDYININLITGSNNPSANWHYAWKSTTNNNQGHRALAATDNALYFCNDTFIGSLIEIGTFDPTNAATYTYNTAALALPTFDQATCLAQLGTLLLVGGTMNYVYPWDRISTSFSYPIVLAEEYVKCIVSTNSSAYILAGSRGNIYITNGANVEIYKKFPDSLSGTVDPVYDWGWALYHKNQIFFSISSATNSGTTINNFAGIWSLDLTTKVIRMSNSLSYGTYSGTVPVLTLMGNVRPTGDGIYSGWLNSTGGIDYTSGSPYINYEARIDSDIIPVGTFLNKTSFTNLEYKLAKPLVSGEKVKLSQRSNLNDSFTEIGNTTTAGGVSDYYLTNFENMEWIQIRAELSSTATTPSYVPLLEIRIR